MANKIRIITFTGGSDRRVCDRSRTVTMPWSRRVSFAHGARRFSPLSDHAIQIFGQRRDRRDAVAMNDRRLPARRTTWRKNPLILATPSPSAYPRFVRRFRTVASAVKQKPLPAEGICDDCDHTELRLRVLVTNIKLVSFFVCVFSFNLFALIMIKMSWRRAAMSSPLFKFNTERFYR